MSVSTEMLEQTEKEPAHPAHLTLDFRCGMCGMCGFFFRYNLLRFMLELVSTYAYLAQIYAETCLNLCRTCADSQV